MKKIDENKFIEKYLAYADKNRIPISGTIEITTNCNFDCLHCYIPEKANKLTLQKFENYLTQIKSMGCKFLTLTGGEPLTHHDFKKMYVKAYKMGFSITIYTNASLIDDETIKIFKSYPPRNIDITIYGSSEDTYEKITKRKGSFNTVIENIEKLAKNKINIHLKCTVLKYNYNEISKIKDLASKYSKNFRLDYELMPKTNLDDEPLNYQVSNKDLKEIENEPNLKTLQNIKSSSRKSEKIFSCTAGRSSFVIDSQGEVRICNFASFISYSLEKYDFNDIWEKYDLIVNKKFDKNDKCYVCKYKHFCTNCPIKSYYHFKKGELGLYPINKYCDQAKKSFENYERLSGE